MKTNAVKPEVLYQAIDKHGTVYQIRPNPDSPPGTGYQYGAVLEVKDIDDTSFHTDIHISPDVLTTLGLGFIEAGKDMND